MIRHFPGPKCVTPHISCTPNIREKNTEKSAAYTRAFTVIDIDFRRFLGQDNVQRRQSVG